MNTPKVKIEVIGKDNGSLYMERETGLTHSAFDRELMIFNCIKNGHVDEVIRLSEEYFRQGITMGNLSENSVRQNRYWAVSTIAVAVHYAILGGLDETDAFNMSDVAIRHIDTLTDINDILYYLMDQSTNLTYAVYNAKANCASTMPVRKCIHYIHVHLHEKITVQDLARECGLSRNYISLLFKSEIGSSIHSYILNEKLEASKALLLNGIPSSEISYQLSFCSESHFIECFREKYGMTPGEFLISSRR